MGRSIDLRGGRVHHLYSLLIPGSERLCSPDTLIIGHSRYGAQYIIAWCLYRHDIKVATLTYGTTASSLLRDRGRGTALRSRGSALAHGAATAQSTNPATR